MARAATAAAARRALGCRRAPGALADDHIHRRSQAERHRRAAGARRPNQRSGVAPTPRSPWRRRSSPGDLVLLDDLAAHKVAGVRQAIAAAGATILYRRPTPDLNLIEQLFAKLRRSCVTPRRAPRTRSVRQPAASASSCCRANVPITSSTAAMLCSASLRRRLKRLRIEADATIVQPSDVETSVEAPSLGERRIMAMGAMRGPMPAGAAQRGGCCVGVIRNPLSWRRVFAGALRYSYRDTEKFKPYSRSDG
jgi:hypothetical protein